MQFEAPFNVNPIDYMCELKLANLSQKIRLEASIIICCHLKKWNGKSKRILNCTIALILHFQTCLLYLQSCVSTNPKSELFSGSVSHLRGPTRQSPISSGQTGLRPGWEFLVHSTKKWTDVALRLVSHLSWQICRLWKLFLEARHHWTALKVSVWVTSARLR